MPKEMGGPGGDKTNPEQLFAAGYAACFHSAMQAVARRQKITLHGDLHHRQGRACIRLDNGGFALAVELAAHAARLRAGRQADQLVSRRPPGLPLLQRDPRQHRV